MIGRHIVAGSILAVIAVCGAAVAAGVRHNLTPSMPVGFWLKKPLLRPPHVGDIVEACLPSDMPLFEQTRRYVGHGPCPNGLEPVVKTVAAIGDDEVRVEQSGISVNGQAIPNTAAMAVDGTGRPLIAHPAGTYRTPPDRVWLIATHSPASYDSRYFGPVPVTSLSGLVSPLWTWR